ncbi:MAG: hypothetical protein M1812_004620 [Candelaria pacifica]|nr:MAG: hypothetical protein M1812_004620 [Candelaria pacifica]
MEAVGAAASIITLVKTTRALLNICSAIDDAPAQVADIIEDLHLLQEIINEINAASSSSPSLSTSGTPQTVVLKSVEQCNSKLLKLSTLLHGFDLSASSRRRRTWASVKAVLRQDKIERLQRALEAAKISLIPARQLLAEQLHRDGIVTLTNRFEDAKVHQQHAIDSTLAVNTDVVKIRESITNLEAGSSHIIRKIDATVSDMNTIKGSCENIGFQNEHIISNTLHAKTLAADVKAHVVDIHSAVRQIQHRISTVELSLSSQADHFERTMSGIVKSALTSPEIQTVLQSLVTTAISSTSHGSTRPSSGQELHRIKVPPQKHSQRRLSIEVSSYRQSYKSFFGTIHYCTKVLKTAGSRSDAEPDFVQRHEMETTFIIVPAPWISHRAVRVAYSNSSQGPFFTLRFSPVVPNDALVFEFAKTGNVEGMRSLFGKGLASAWDTDMRGYTPLHFLLGCGADSNAATHADGLIPIHSPSRMGPLADQRIGVNCTRLLIEQGHADPSIKPWCGVDAFIVFARFNISSLQWLLQHESLAFDPIHQEREGSSVLASLFQGWEIFRAQDIVASVVEMLLNNGADPHAVDRSGKSTTSHAMRAPHNFVLWRRAITTRMTETDSLLRFVDQELHQRNQLSGDGWTPKSLLALFQAEIVEAPRRTRLYLVDAHGDRFYFTQSDVTVWHQQLSSLNPSWPHPVKWSRRPYLGYVVCKCHELQEQQSRLAQQKRYIHLIRQKRPDTRIARKRWNSHQHCWQWTLYRLLPESLREYRVRTFFTT